MSQKKLEQKQTFLAPKRQNFKKKWSGNNNSNSSNNDLTAALIQLLKKDEKKEAGTSNNAGGGSGGGHKKLSIKQLKAIKPCSKCFFDFFLESFIVLVLKLL